VDIHKNDPNNNNSDDPRRSSLRIEENCSVKSRN